MNEEKLDNILNDIDLGEDYVLIYKDFENVLKDIEFANDDERLLTHSIIENLEKEASRNFVKDLAVDIPYIGIAQRNLLRKEVIKSFKELDVARRELPEEEYKVFKKELIKRKKVEISNIEIQKRFNKNNRNRYFKLWLKLSRQYSVAYATFYVKMFKQLNVIEFNQELNDAYVESWS